MDVLKPYSCSLKKINAKDSLQYKDISNYLRDYTLSQGIKKKPAFTPKMNKNEIKKGFFIGLTPFRLQNNPSAQQQLKTIMTKNEDIRSTSETKRTNQSYTLLPLHKKRITNRQTRSKFEQKMDEMMNLVIQQEKFPLEKKNMAFHRNHNNYCNIRILTEITEQQRPYTKYRGLNEESNIDRTIADAINITLNRSKTQKQKRLKTIVTEEKNRDQCKINTHLNYKEATKNSKQLQRHNQDSKNIWEQQERALHRVINCHKYLKQFREGKSSIKDLHLHKY